MVITIGGPDLSPGLLWLLNRDTELPVLSSIRSANKKEDKSIMKAYCMKCKKEIEIRDPRPVRMKNGADATRGTCSSCGGKVFRIGKQR